MPNEDLMVGVVPLVSIQLVSLAVVPPCILDDPHALLPSIYQVHTYTPWFVRPHSCTRSSAVNNFLTTAAITGTQAAAAAL